jgi:hypothetical protein
MVKLFAKVAVVLVFGVVGFFLYARLFLSSQDHHLAEIRSRDRLVRRSKLKIGRLLRESSQALPADDLVIGEVWMPELSRKILVGRPSDDNILWIVKAPETMVEKELLTKALSTHLRDPEATMYDPTNGLGSDGLTFERLDLGTAFR